MTVTYSTLMVHLDGARPNAAVLDVAATIAKRHDAKVIGIAVCQPIQLAAGDGYIDGPIAMIAGDLVTDELAHAKLEFHAHIGLRPHVLEWRSIPTLENVAHAVAEQARCADLVITAIGRTPGNNLATHADTGELILRAGRPVLVVPDAHVTADFRNVLVAWTDTRECRRAIMDALPVLRRADRVTIVEASKDPVHAREGIEDIAGWLARHGVGADRIVSRMKGSGFETLAMIATEIEADLVVAGAYGHSRIREWAFGGVTRDLLLYERRCTLLSH
jgi:nucleotide-binding universal stress UspA family protein